MENDKIFGNVLFKKIWEDEIKEFAMEMIEENKADYFDGYTAITDESYEEVFQTNYEHFVYEFAKTKGKIKC